MRLVFAGTPEIAVPALNSLAESNHQLVAVVTRPDAPAGRGRKLQPSPVAAKAKEFGLPVLSPEHPKDPDFLTELARFLPDVCPVVAYGALLPESALKIPKHGWVNLHFSLLPRWRGAAPVQRAIMAGDSFTGTTCFRIVRQLDAGPIFDAERVDFFDETAGELLDRLAISGAAQLVRVMDAIDAGAIPTEQSVEGITMAAKLTTDQARINFSLPAQQLKNQILGCSPHPGAWCEDDSGRLKILRARLTTGLALSPGELSITKKQVFVGTGNGTLELLEVQSQGKRRMPAIDWARGTSSGALR